MAAVKPMAPNVRKSSGRQPVEWFDEVTGETYLIKPLKLRQVLTVYGHLGEERTVMENMEAVYRLAVVAFVNEDGSPRFEDLDEAEERLGYGDIFTAMSDALLEIQGLAGKPKKK